MLIFVAFGVYAGEKSAVVTLSVGNATYEIELAVTAAERGRGLMFRDRLEPDRGMLLVYPEAGDHRIWMKNVRIPLRVFWIDDNFEVIEMQRLEPCRRTPCPVFAASRPSRYVLELGDYEHAIEAGDRIQGLRDL